MFVPIYDKIENATITLKKIPIKWTSTKIKTIAIQVEILYKRYLTFFLDILLVPAFFGN